MGISKAGIKRLQEQARELNNSTERDYSKEIDSSGFAAAMLGCETNKDALQFAIDNDIHSLTDILAYSCKRTYE